MIDSLDLKIIQTLQKDARTPFSDIAKMLGVSASVIQIRFNKMKDAGLILGTTLRLDIEKFDVKYLISIGVRASELERKEVIRYMNNLTMSESKIFIWPTLGRFNITALIMSRNLLELGKIRQSIKEHPCIKEVCLSVNTSWYASNYGALGLEKELKR